MAEKREDTPNNQTNAQVVQLARIVCGVIVFVVATLQDISFAKPEGIAILGLCTMLMTSKTLGQVMGKD